MTGVQTCALPISMWKTGIQTANIINRAVPITNDGKLIPTSAIRRVAKSRTPPGLTAPTMPAVRPMMSARMSAAIPRTIDRKSVV